MSILPKAVHRLNEISNPQKIFAEIEKPILNFIWTHKGLK